MDKLLEKIEQMRSEMNELARQRGMADQLVLEKSQQLDELLNQYSREQGKKPTG